MAINSDRPINISGKRFQNYPEAADYLVRRVSERHSVSRLFVPAVLGALIERGDGLQDLRLIGGGVVGTVERHMHGVVPGGVSVSTSPGGGCIDVIAHVEPLSSKVLDRGLAWVRVGAEIPPLFHVTILAEHGLESPLELASHLETAEQKSVDFVEAILRSEILQPYARGYGEAA